jgi:hypothetical protein
MMLGSKLASSIVSDEGNIVGVQAWVGNDALHAIHVPVGFELVQVAEEWVGKEKA